MRNVFYCVLPGIVVALLLFSGCQKTPEMPASTAAYYTQRFLYDSAFAEFYYQTGMQIIQAKREGLHEQFKQMQEQQVHIQQDQQRNPLVHQRINTNNDEAEQVYQYTATTLTHATLFYLSNPGFFALPPTEQQQVLQQINQYLSDPSYCEIHASSALVSAHDRLQVEAGRQTAGFAVPGGDPSKTMNDLSSGIIGACITGAIGAIIYDYGGLIKTIASAFTGTNRVLWGMVFQVAKTVVKTAVPWYKVLGLAIGLGTCLWSAL